MLAPRSGGRARSVPARINLSLFVVAAILAWAGSASAAPRFWVTGGTDCSTAGTRLFNNTSCWSTTSGGATGAAVPVAADDVTFDSNGVNCSVNQAVSVNSITLAESYVNTVTTNG